MLLDNNDMSALVNFKSNLENHYKTVLFVVRYCVTMTW